MTGYLVKGQSLPHAWEEGLRLIWNHGEFLGDQRGSDTIEILSLMTVIPYGKITIPKLYPHKERALKDYRDQLCHPCLNSGFVYTYGNRTQAWGHEIGQPINQIDYAIKQLSDSPSSRRAVASTWLPTFDCMREEVPCMMVCQFILRHSDLTLDVYFRSHDFAGAYPANVYGLFGLLEMVADKLYARPKEICTISASAHVYDWDWPLWARVLGEEELPPQCVQAELSLANLREAIA
jgi:thymidylate synthase